MNQKGYLQIILALVIIAILLLIVLNYLSQSWPAQLETEEYESSNPAGLIEKIDQDIDLLQDQKNKQLQQELDQM